MAIQTTRRASLIRAIAQDARRRLGRPARLAPQPRDTQAEQAVMDAAAAHGIPITPGWTRPELALAQVAWETVYQAYTAGPLSARA